MTEDQGGLAVVLQERLDRMYLRWQTFQRSVEESPPDGTFQNAAAVAEAKFKGAVEVLGGERWEWTAEGHIEITSSD